MKLFVPLGHYYSPVVDATEARRHIELLRLRQTPDSLPGITLKREGLLQNWRNLLPFLTTAPFSEQRDPAFRYCFNNPSYAWADGLVLQAMIRLHQPARFVEIGNGWSSACALDTVERYLGGKCHITFMDPFPQLLRELIPELPTNAEILSTRVQDVPIEVFKSLQAGDILFIDSSHILKTGSDVCFELFEIITRLAPGVLVHFHDIFWPFEYPEAWVLEDNRSWNELYAVRAFLTDNAAWQILMFNDYLAQTERTLIAATCPSFLRNSGGALWLQRR